MLKSAVNIICLACLLGVPGTLTASAQPSPVPISTDAPTVSPERQALVEELLVLTKQEENANRMLDSMLAQIETTLPQFVSDTLSKTTNLKDQALQEQVTALSARMAKRYRELLLQRIDIGQITTQINASLYAKYYTEGELQGLIDFYRTPLGQKTIEITPQLSEEALQQSNKLLLPKVMEVVQEIMAEEFGQLQSPENKDVSPFEAPDAGQQPDSKK
ncbi:MAG: DUF2059 domain-containing protein [Cyanobacteria bacterium P01_A01_bin.17]